MLPLTRSTLRILLLAALSVAIYFIVLNTTGRLTVSEGRGWDGAAYVDMLRYGLVDHASNERLRPLIVAFNRPLYWLSDRSIPGAIDAFASMPSASSAGTASCWKATFSVRMRGRRTTTSAMT